MMTNNSLIFSIKIAIQTKNFIIFCLHSNMIRLPQYLKKFPTITALKNTCLVLYNRFPLMTLKCLICLHTRIRNTHSIDLTTILKCIVEKKKNQAYLESKRFNWP